MLFAKNAPEWAMAYFGILKAGATSVPVGHESTVAELVNVARASGAVGILIGDDLLRETRGGAGARAAPRRGWPPGCGRFSEAFALPDLEVETDARRGAGAPAEPGRAGVADLHLGDDRQAQGGDADPPQLHLHGVGAVEDLRVRGHRRDAVGAAAAPHLRVRDRPAGAAGARRADHLPARADGRRDLGGAQARARHRHRGRAGAVGSAAAAAVPALRRQVAGAGRLHARARQGELRAAQRAPASTSGMLLFLPVHEGFGGRIRYLISGGSALPRRGAEGVLGHGLQLLRGLRPDRDGAGADGDVAQEEADRRARWASRCPASRSRSTTPIEHRRGRGDRARPQRDGRLLAGRGGDRRGDPRRLVPHRRSRALRRRRQPVPRRADRRTSSSTPTARTSTPTRSRTCTATTRSSRSCRSSASPDGIGEQVACAVVARSRARSGAVRGGGDRQGRGALPQGLGRPAVLEAGRGVHFWEGDLPKTAKRSIKRREVVAEIARLRRKHEETKGALAAAGEGGQVAWLLDTVATVSGRRRADVQLGSRFGELGFDSLMYAELSSALEDAGVALPESVDVTTLGTVAELQELARRAGRAAAARELAAKRARRRRRGDPRARRRSPARASAGLAWAQRAVLPAGAVDTQVQGPAPHPPAHQLHRRRQPLPRTSTWARSRSRWATRAAT